MPKGRLPPHCSVTAFHCALCCGESGMPARRRRSIVWQKDAPMRSLSGAVSGKRPLKRCTDLDAHRRTVYVVPFIDDMAALMGK